MQLNKLHSHSSYLKFRSLYNLGFVIKILKRSLVAINNSVSIYLSIFRAPFEHAFRNGSSAKQLHRVRKITLFLGWNIRVGEALSGGSELKVAPHLISAFRINRAIIHVRPLLFVEGAYALYSVYCVRTSCRNVEVKQACSPPTAPCAAAAAAPPTCVG